ncbi:hypothetical protein [Myxococcus eversor]|uniref:hypothetical protein n=1 Tax=Myxococcus eversor TaxID=2709661 RepID=UPI0013D4D3BE|nr:hypothetical protein [Myxococcus eversor]
MKKLTTLKLKLAKLKTKLTKLRLTRELFVWTMAVLLVLGGLAHGMRGCRTLASEQTQPEGGVP